MTSAEILTEEINKMDFKIIIIFILIFCLFINVVVLTLETYSKGNKIEQQEQQIEDLKYYIRNVKECYYE